jgi:hypothetical protein
MRELRVHVVERGAPSLVGAQVVAVPVCHLLHALHALRLVGIVHRLGMAATSGAAVPPLQDEAIRERVACARWREEEREHERQGRYRGQNRRRMLRGDAAFALPDVYQYLEAEAFRYAICLPANQVLQAKIADLLKRPVGRPPHSVRRFYASFRYQAQSRRRSRRVVAKVECHPGELYPRVGFIVTNLRRPAKKVVAFYNGRGTAEQWIKDGKHAVKWTRLSCISFRGNAVRLQLHALAYNLANFLRTLVLPAEVAQWSLTSLREKVVKIGAKVITHGRYLVFQMAEVAVPRELFRRLLDRIATLRPPAVARC